MKKLLSLLPVDYHRILGGKKADYRVFGIPAVIIRERDPWHKDLYFFLIPLFRIVNEPQNKDLQLLVLTWLFKAVKHIFTKWEILKTENCTQLRFEGHVIYKETLTAPFNFPTAAFKG